MGSTLFRNARLFDGIADQPREGAWIHVEGDRIAAVGEAGAVPPAAESEVDLGGKTVVPGLIDTHVHTMLIGDQGLPLFLAAGVTSARDVGGELSFVLALREDLAKRRKLGPRLRVCGPLLDGAESSFPPTGPIGRILDRVPSVDAVPEKVGGLLRAGVDGVKLYFTMPTETARAVIRFVDHAVPVTGHLGYTRSLDAIEAGIDGLEHVWISPYNEFCALDMRFGPGASMTDPGFWGRTLEGWEKADVHAPLARRWFDAMVTRQVAMGTTLDLLWAARCGPEGVRNDPDWQHGLRARPPEGSRSGADGGASPETRAALFDPYRGRAALEKHQEVTRILHESGGVVIGGTDCGAIPYPPPGFALLREVELLAEAIGAHAALRAVTSSAARALRWHEDVGSIATGRYADFLVVDGDPLRDVRELRRLVRVYQGGVAHEPAALLAARRARSAGAPA